MKISTLILGLGLAVMTIGCSGKVTVNSNTPANAPATTNSPAANNNSNSSAATSNSNAPVTVTGKWEMVGKAGDWKDTVDMVGMDGFLWSVEADGSLYKTDPATGNFTQVGDKGSFRNLKHLEAGSHAVDCRGRHSTRMIQPPAWERMGEGGGWGQDHRDGRRMASSIRLNLTAALENRQDRQRYAHRQRRL